MNNSEDNNTAATNMERVDFESPDLKEQLEKTRQATQARSDSLYDQRKKHRESNRALKYKADLLSGKYDTYDDMIANKALEHFNSPEYREFYNRARRVPVTFKDGTVMRGDESELLIEYCKLDLDPASVPQIMALADRYNIHPREVLRMVLAKQAGGPVDPAKPGMGVLN